MAVAILAAFALVIVWSSLLGLGIVLAYRGWRGRWVDHDPHCAACDYLLIGLRIGLTGAGRSCPECGADLGASRAIAPGSRRPAPRQISTGLALAIIPIVALAAAVPVLWTIRAQRLRAPAVRPAAPSPAGAASARGLLTPVAGPPRPTPLSIVLPSVTVTDSPDDPVLARLDLLAPAPSAPVDPQAAALGSFAAPAEASSDTEDAGSLEAPLDRPLDPQSPLPKRE